MRRKYVPDIVHLGALFEGNYRRLIKLLNLTADDNEVRFVLSTGDNFVGRVRIKLLESCKYTDTLYLEQVSSAGKWVNDPQMTVRMYHDVNVAEVISSCGHRKIQAVNDYPNKFMHHPDEKDQLNSFLAEWLDFCIKNGCCESVPDHNIKM